MSFNGQDGKLLTAIKDSARCKDSQYLQNQRDLTKVLKKINNYFRMERLV